MKEKNPMPIRKFSLIGIIGLALIIFSMIGNIFAIEKEILVTIQTYVVLISQILGNVLFGISLLGYFMHLKENKILKWTSLFIGIFYILNFFSVKNLLSLFYDEFGLFNYLSNSLAFSVYSLLVSIGLIFFGYAISKLGKVNKLIAVLSIVFIFSNVYVVAINFITNEVSSILGEFNITMSEVMINDMMIKYQIFNMLSYVALLTIFTTLYINQKVAYTKTFKVKVENYLDEK